DAAVTLTLDNLNDTLTITAADFTQDRQASVFVENDDNPSDTETITVQVERTPTPADLEVSTNGVLLSEGTPSVSVNILNLGEVDLNWSASSNDATVTLTPDNVNDTLTITATDFMEDRTAQVTVTNDDNPSDTETINAQVEAAPTPADLEVSTNGVLLSEGTPSVSVNILNLGEVDLNWSANSNDAAVTLTLDNLNDTLTITAADFTQDRQASVFVENDDNPSDTETINVQVERTPTPADLEVSTNGVLLSDGTPS
ncbi:unnamed protein product, partial [marine sediment metagenome]